MRHLIWLLVPLIVVVGGAYGILRWWQRVPTGVSDAWIREKAYDKGGSGY